MNRKLERGGTVEQKGSDRSSTPAETLERGILSYKSKEGEDEQKTRTK